VDFEEKNMGLTTGLPGISHHNGRAGLTWAAMPKLFLTPSLAIRSRPQNVRGGALAKQLDLPWDVNLHVLYQATKFLDVYVTVRNAFDHHYALGGITGDAIPQETFSVVGGLRCSF